MPPVFLNFIKKIEGTAANSRLEVFIWDILLRRCQDLTDFEILRSLVEDYKNSGVVKASANLQLSLRFNSRRLRLLKSICDVFADRVERFRANKSLG